jgi:hypothetical protein
MKIAIDLNDVIRDYSDNFLRVYVTNYNREYDTDEFELWTNEMQNILPFKTKKAYQNFTYVDYAFDIFGKCDVCSRKLSVELNAWINSLKDFDLNEPIDMMVVSPMEFGESINYSYFFVSKLGCSIREVYFPMDSSTIWDKCDVLITANPKLLESKPEGKVAIRIEKDYNKDKGYDYTFKTLSEFLTNEDNTTKLIEKCGVK